MPGYQPNMGNPMMNQRVFAKRDETVSKLTPQQLAMPRISVYITVPEKG